MVCTGKPLVALLTFALCLMTEGRQVVAMADDSSYLQITGPCHLEFPRDHGAHPGYKTEWWYYTGNLQSDGGERFGFQLTFFRSQISPPGAEKNWPKPNSPWRTNQVFLAQAALSDIGGKHFFHAEQVARGAMGLAGVRQDLPDTSVFLKGWSATLTPDQHDLRAVTDRFSFDLTLHPLKSLVLHGDDGYTIKGSTPERSSCYYSFTRLQTRGTLQLDGRYIPVSGLSWMDHEFSSAPLESGIVGWDWFSLQLSNDTELMVYLMREKDGSHSPASSGTFVDVSGRAVHLTADAIRVEVLDEWRSPHTGARYPSRWMVHVPALHCDLTVEPKLADQEMRSPQTTGVSYWEGSVSIRGTADGLPVTGSGYVELTGYEKPFDAPM